MNRAIRRRKVVSINRRGPAAQRNARVRVVDREQWRENRRAKMEKAISFAAGVKAYRTVMGVTQTEMGEVYGVSAATIANWESGAYFGWDVAGMERWCVLVRAAARH